MSKRVSPFVVIPDSRLERLLASSADTKKIKCTHRPVSCRCSVHRALRWWDFVAPMRQASSAKRAQRQRDNDNVLRWQRELGPDKPRRPRE